MTFFWFIIGASIGCGILAFMCHRLSIAQKKIDQVIRTVQK